MTEPIAAIIQLWRFPVKSMRGEPLDTLDITAGGVSGDRWFALKEVSTRKLCDARRTPRLLHYKAAIQSRADDFALVTLPDGRQSRTDSADLPAAISADLNMQVSIERRANSQAYGFLDDAAIHIASQQTLDTLQSLNETGEFDVRRFRPNILLNTPSSSSPFPEDLWLGRVLAVGRHVRLQITKACARCAMTTLPQDELRSDHSVLKTVVDENTGNVGVYATVITGGTIRVGDNAWLE